MVRHEGRAHTSTLVGFIESQVVLLPSIFNVLRDSIRASSFYA
jgi:hypothetical protein